MGNGNNWARAYFLQAKSDYRILVHFMEARKEGKMSETCHILHYLQMSTEKLAKSLNMMASSASHPPTSHKAFVNFLRTRKNAMDPHLMNALRISENDHFRRYVDSLLPIAQTIQDLVPTVAGLAKANPEYPWEDQSSPGSNGTPRITAPCESQTHWPVVVQSPVYNKILKFLGTCLKLYSPLSSY